MCTLSRWLHLSTWEAVGRIPLQPAHLLSFLLYIHSSFLAQLWLLFPLHPWLFIPTASFPGTRAVPRFYPLVSVYCHLCGPQWCANLLYLETNNRKLQLPLDDLGSSTAELTLCFINFTLLPSVNPRPRLHFFISKYPHFLSPLKCIFCSSHRLKQWLPKSSMSLLSLKPQFPALSAVFGMYAHSLNSKFIFLWMWHHPKTVMRWRLWYNFSTKSTLVQIKACVRNGTACCRTEITGDHYWLNPVAMYPIFKIFFILLL